MMGEASSSVPCGTCNLCCHGRVFLSPDEDATGLEVVVESAPMMGPHAGKKLRRLATTASGVCVHLEHGKCTVYERRPRICRQFDCREHYHLPSAERRRREALLTHPRDRAIIARGRELVEQARRG